MEVITEEGIATIPIEDLNQIMLNDTNIRHLLINLSILSQSKVALMTLDEKYLPTAIILPFDGHAGQYKLMHAQVNTDNANYKTKNK